MRQIGRSREHPLAFASILRSVSLENCVLRCPPGRTSDWDRWPTRSHGLHGASVVFRADAPYDAVMDPAMSSDLLPGDVIAALRSFPRRLAEALEPLHAESRTEEERRDLALHQSDDGKTVAALVRDGATDAAALAHSLSERLPGVDPPGSSSTPPPPSAPDGSEPADPLREVDAALEDLRGSLVDSSEVLATLPSSAWGEVVGETPDTSLSLLDLTQRHVASIAATLRAVQQTLES